MQALSVFPLACIHVSRRFNGFQQNDNGIPNSAAPQHPEPIFHRVADAHTDFSENGGFFMKKVLSLLIALCFPAFSLTLLTAAAEGTENVPSAETVSAKQPERAILPVKGKGV